MSKSLGGLVDTVISFVFTFGVGSVVVNEAYNFIRQESLTKIQKGLSSTSVFTEKLTCIKHDNNWNASRVNTASCKKHWRREDQRRAKYKAIANGKASF